jgi:hypothetical protein
MRIEYSENNRIAFLDVPLTTDENFILEDNQGDAFYLAVIDIVFGNANV